MNTSVTRGRAKQSIGQLVRTGAFWLEPDGLRLRREGEESAVQVSIDHVMQRLIALGLQDDNLSVQVRVGRPAKRSTTEAFLVLCIDLDGTEILADEFPAIRAALDALPPRPVEDPRNFHGGV